MLPEVAYFSVQETLTSPGAGCIAGPKKCPHPCAHVPSLRTVHSRTSKSIGFADDFGTIGTGC